MLIFENPRYVKLFPICVENKASLMVLFFSHLVLIFCAFLVAFVEGTIYSYQRYPLPSELLIYREQAQYSPSDTPSKSYPGNGESFIDYSQLVFSRVWFNFDPSCFLGRRTTIRYVPIMTVLEMRLLSRVSMDLCQLLCKFGCVMSFIAVVLVGGCVSKRSI